MYVYIIHFSFSSLGSSCLQMCNHTNTHAHTLPQSLYCVFFFPKPKRTHFPLCSHSLINRFIVKASLLDTICLLSDHPRLQHEEKMLSNIILAQRYHCVSRTHLRHFSVIDSLSTRFGFRVQQTAFINSYWNIQYSTATKNHELFQNVTVKWYSKWQYHLL